MNGLGQGRAGESRSRRRSDFLNGPIFNGLETLTGSKDEGLPSSAQSSPSAEVRLPPSLSQRCSLVALQAGTWNLSYFGPTFKVEEVNDRHSDTRVRCIGETGIIILLEEVHVNTLIYVSTHDS